MALQGERGLEERCTGAGDAVELSVMTGFGGEAGEVHGEKGGVGTEESRPEVEFAEGFG